MDQPTIPPPGVLDGYKKLLAMLVALAAWIAGRWGLNLDQADLAGVLTPVLVYILAQGRADHGKAAAQIDARAGAGRDDTIAALAAEIADIRKLYAADLQADGNVKFPKVESAAPSAPFTEGSELPKIKAVVSMPDPLPPPPPKEVP